jgi:hypothetical protein
MRVGLLVAALLSLAAAGCGTQNGTEVDAGGELEALIYRQLPAETKRLTGSRSFVRNVGCVKSTGSSYECLATISGPNAYGEYVTEQLPIEGTCDEAQCIWKVSP